MFDIELSAGTIEYEDTGVTGAVLVFVRGLLMDGTGWRHVADKLPSTYRCLLPTCLSARTAYRCVRMQISPLREWAVSSGSM